MNSLPMQKRELHKAVSYHYNRPSFFTHLRAHLCPYGLPVALPLHEPGKQAGTLASLPACFPLPRLRLHWLLHGLKKTDLLAFLPSLPFFFIACFFLFPLYVLHWHPRRRLLWKSSPWVKVVVKREVTETESFFHS